MKRLFFVIVCLSFVLTSSAQAKKKADIPLTGVVQEVRAATLEDGNEETHKPKKHKVAKHKKNKKVKKQ